MIPYISDSDNSTATPIEVVDIDDFDTWLDKQPVRHQNWISTHDFDVKDGNSLPLPDEEGGIACILLTKDVQEWDVWSLATLPASLPVGTYYLNAKLEGKQATDAAIGWSLAT